MYTLEELLKRWQLGTLSVEQAIGQLLQHLLVMQKQIKQLKSTQPPTQKT
jgi:hypothetical protein